jgi:hypothetical protein
VIVSAVSFTSTPGRTDEVSAPYNSTQKHRRFMLKKHLLPRFGNKGLFEITRQEIQMYVAHLTQKGVREAVYDGTFGTPKTEAGLRQIPLSDASLKLIGDWKQRAARTEPDALLFSTRTGRSISPNNVVRRAIFPACDALKLRRATWLTSVAPARRGRTTRVCLARWSPS